VQKYTISAAGMREVLLLPVASGIKATTDAKNGQATLF
jgi:hypothetical protein